MIVLNISDDFISMKSNEGTGTIMISPSDGPDDPIVIDTGAFDLRLERDEVDRLQEALVNFLNTGNFNQEA